MDNHEAEAAERYRNRAQELRAIAAQTHDLSCKHTILDIAEDYDRMAETLAGIGEANKPSDKD